MQLLSMDYTKIFLYPIKETESNCKLFRCYAYVTKKTDNGNKLHFTHFVTNDINLLNKKFR